jgi:hypothetical protein
VLRCNTAINICTIYRCVVVVDHIMLVANVLTESLYRLPNSHVLPDSLRESFAHPNSTLPVCIHSNRCRYHSGGAVHFSTLLL